MRGDSLLVIVLVGRMCWSMVFVSGYKLFRNGRNELVKAQECVDCFVWCLEGEYGNQ